MLSTLIHTALFVSLAARHVAADLQIDTPSITQCQDVEVKWSGGTPPYNLYVVPSSDSCADSVIDIPEQTGTSYKWNVNIPQGAQIEILVEDSTQDEGWTGVITVGNSSDSSCVDKKAAQALSAAAPSSSPANSSAAAPSGASASGSVATPSAAAAKVPAVTASAAPPPPEGGLANAANGEGNTPQSSGSISRVALPGGSILATAAFLLAIAHL